MKQLVHDDYSYLDKIEWSQKVRTMNVSFNLLTGDRIGQRIEIPVRTKDGNIWNALIENKILVDDDELKAKVLHRTEKAVKDRISRRVTNYKKGVDIYNALTELVVKDKRKDGYDDGRYNGEVLPNEISKEHYEDYLSENEFKFMIDCDYDYNWDNDTYESKYIYKNSFVHESVTTEFCNIEIKFEIQNCDSETKLFYKTPHFSLDLLYTNKKNQEARIDLISSSSFEKVWKNGKHHQKMTFQSYVVCSTSRYVNLNTFMVYTRQTSKENQEQYIRDTERRNNKNKIQQDIIDKYPDAKIVEADFYKNNITHNYSSEWGRYGMKCFSVEFKDNSYILYSVNKATQGELKVVGVFDSKYKKPDVVEIVTTLTKRNK